MQNYKIEALWDCVYCHSKGIGGSKMSCPFCGHARGSEVRFYLPKDISQKNAVEGSKVSQNPDWMCIYCRSYNSDFRLKCGNCGAERNSQNLDYYHIQTQAEEKKN